jgi:hypothetical protein
MMFTRSRERETCQVEVGGSRLPPRVDPQSKSFAFVVLVGTLCVRIVPTMKFSAIILASLVGSAHALSSATQPKTVKVNTGGAPSMDPVDKRLEGIDSDPNTFDPTEGESPALFRNNNDEVWVKQVRHVKLAVNFFDICQRAFQTHSRIFLFFRRRELGLVATASRLQSEAWSERTL